MGRWYCAYPSIRECAPPRDLPVKPVKIDDKDMLDLGLGRSIYSKAQVEEFLKFQDSQGTRSWPMEDVESMGPGDSSLGQCARGALIDAVGWSLMPLYCLTGPIAVFILLGLLVWTDFSKDDSQFVSAFSKAAGKSP